MVEDNASISNSIDWVMWCHTQQLGPGRRSKWREVTVVSVVRQRSVRPLVAMEAKLLRRQPDPERSGGKSGVEKELVFEEPSAYRWDEAMRVKLTTEW